MTAQPHAYVLEVLRNPGRLSERWVVSTEAEVRHTAEQARADWTAAIEAGYDPAQVRVAAISAADPGALQLSISTIEGTNFGDHGERIRRDHVLVPGETVEQLALRVFPGLTRPYRQHNTTDVIEIRVLTGADGKCTGNGEVTGLEAFRGKPS